MTSESSSIAFPDGIPSGLIAVTRLTSTVSVGEDFIIEDRRLSCAFPIRKHLRVIRGTENAWWSKLIPHVASFSAREIQHVTGFLESGPLTDGIYLLTDDHPAVLADLIGPEPTPEKVAKSLLDQIAHGLAEFHQNFGPHGNLCLRSIRVSKATLDQDVHVSIANAEVGRLAVWSDLAVIPKGFAETRPPEWRGDGTDQLTKEGDVYALGLIASELLLGASAFRDARQSAANTKLSLPDVLEARLKAQGVTWSYRRKVQRLFAVSPTARPRDGQAALELLSATLWDHWGWRAAALILVLIWLIIRSGARTETPEELLRRLGNLQRDIADKNSKVIRLELTLDQRQKELDLRDKELARQTLELESSRSNVEKLNRIAELVAQPVPDLAAKIVKILDLKVSSTPTDLAQQHWLDLNSDQPISKLLEQIERLRQQKKIPDDQTKLLKTWVGQINSRLANWSAWSSRRQPEEKVLIETWVKFRNAPWDESLRHSADQTSDGLRTACRIWWEYASAAKSESWNNFRSNLETEARAQPNPIVERVLNAWIAEFNRRRTWILRIGKAKAAAGYGQWRLITLYLDGKSHQEDWREWNSDIAHDYGSAKLPLAWRRGQTVDVLLEGERSYLTGTRPNLLSQSFAGPVALWSLHQAGVVRAKDVSLEIDVEDCPGPPRSIIQSFRKLAAESVGASQSPK